MNEQRSAIAGLAARMVGLGLGVGIVLPFVLLISGVPASVALSPSFFVCTVAAATVVGAMNARAAQQQAGSRLRLMTRRLRKVERQLREATYTGDWSGGNPEDDRIPVEREDELGAAAAAFNRLLGALAENHKVESRIAYFTSVMSAELDVEPICQAAIDCFRRDLGAAGVAIIGFSGGSYEVLASHGLSDPGSLIQSDLVQNAIRSLHADSMTMPEHLVIDAAVARLRPQHVIVHPLVMDSTAIGAVVLASSGEVPPSAQALGPLFIRTLSVALSNALSHEDMRRIAAIDGLTGMFNRREGLSRLDRAFTRSRRIGEPLGVIMLDIDHFKRINDAHGHLTGDAVLAEMARAAAEVLRKDDFLIRYGGEEFLAVLPGAGGADIAVIAERIRAAAEKRAVHRDDVDVRVTLSAGYATTDELVVDDAMALVSRADEALLTAKRTGRNRVVAAA